MAIRLWPKDFERKKHITKGEKALLRQAKQHLKEGHFAVGIDPLGMSSDKVRMGLYISPKKGLLTFSIYAEKRDASQKELYANYVQMVENRIYERLLDSKMLIVRDGERKLLKFPYRHVIIFANEKLTAIKETAGKPSDPKFKKISEQECRAIFERLAPEYTVVVKETEEIEIKPAGAVLSEQDFLITGREQAYKTFFLDEYQVAQINDMGKGHRVLLANPGAGKSVLLLSKAFKYASLYKESKVLLTCFNSNLADSYLFKKSRANFGDNRNLYIMTLHKLVKRLFEECLHRRCASNIATPQEIQECIDKVHSGEIQIRFQAIFIDEVQIFEPLYLELCYALLEKNKDTTFLMAGDLNQTVRAQSRKGDAPWKKINGADLDFTGRVKYIEKNYRNSRQISEYLNRMLCYMNGKMEHLHLLSRQEFAYDTFQAGEREGVALNIQTGISRYEIQASVLAAIKEIAVRYRVGYSDMAVLFPYKENRSLRYRFMDWLTEALDQEDIPYSFITPPLDARHKKKRYHETDGVLISTIDSSLGLDFKAVIVAGLFPYNYVFTDQGRKIKISSWENVETLRQAEQEKVQVQIRKLYTACSRARDILYVISDLEPNSPMEEILTKAEGDYDGK